MSPAIVGVILIATLLTAAISGVFGMAGGLTAVNFGNLFYY